MPTSSLFSQASCYTGVHFGTDGTPIAQARPEHAAQLEELQRICFPTLAEEQRFKRAHFLKHMELFDDGQLVALDGDFVVGATSTVRLNFDFNHVDHTFADIIQGGWLTSHEPDGAWLYGADLSVRPEYRGRGLAGALYAARQEVVWRLKLKGQVTAGMIPGYGPLKETMTAEQYYESVLAGRMRDPTLSMQMNVGFQPRGLLANYLDDPICDNYSVLLVLDSEQNVRGASRRETKGRETKECSIDVDGNTLIKSRRRSSFIPARWKTAVRPASRIFL